MLRRLVPAATALALIGTAAQAEFTLHVLHTNDFHSRVEPINKYDATCTAEDAAKGECFGGVARLAAEVARRKAEIAAAGGHAVLLDAGDQYQGSLFYTTYKGKDVAEFMNAVGYDAMAIGNHEFDDGPDGLGVLLDGAQFPVISGNIDVSQSAPLKGRLKPTAVLEVGGQKIGLVSALAMDTPETSSPGKQVIFKDDLDSLKAGVADLQAQGVDKIIALTHEGYRRDQQIAAQVPGIDAVIGGHSHTLLGSMERAAGPYPTMVKSGDAEVPVATAYAYGKYLGDLVLTFDDQGQVTKAEGAPVLLDGTMPQDETIGSRVKEMAAPIEVLLAKQVAEVAAPIDGSRETCRAKECEMGNLLADALLARAKPQGATIAIVNGGGLRASIDQGPVTMGEVYTVLPFQNTLATFETKGATLLAALENGASKMEEGGGRFAQVAGLKYTVDPKAAAGKRISDVQVRGADGSWGPIQPDTAYLVATNNYMRAGGDGYKMFETDAAKAYDFGPDLAEVLADYLSQQGPGFKPALDGRITVR